VVCACVRACMPSGTADMRVACALCLRKLSGPTVDEREQACIAIAGVLGGDKVPATVVTQLLGAGVIDRLLPRVCDKAPSVRQYALGALWCVDIVCV